MKHQLKAIAGKTITGKTRKLLGILFFCFGFASLPMMAQTSWKGTTSTSWATASNWTSGVPTTAIDAIIGDASFTGSFQPAISGQL